MVRTVLLEDFITSPPGYWQAGQENKFPWASTKGVWYALLVVVDGRVERYGFTASGEQKAMLRAALLAIPEGFESLLIGVWTGQFRTDLFVLERTQAIRHLGALP